MKITFGRKFFGCTIATVLMAAVYFVTLIIHAEAVAGGVMIAFGGYTITIWFAYIGGNIWSKWIKAKQEGIK